MCPRVLIGEASTQPTPQAMTPKDVSKQGQAVNPCRDIPGDPTPDTWGPRALGVNRPALCIHAAFNLGSSLLPAASVPHHGITLQLTAIYRSPTVCCLDAEGWWPYLLESRETGYVSDRWITPQGRHTSPTKQWLQAVA